jgi:hypothetical protein
MEGHTGPVTGSLYLYLLPVNGLVTTLKCLFSGVFIIRHRKNIKDIIFISHSEKLLLAENVHMSQLHYLISITTPTCQVCVSTVLSLFAGQYQKGSGLPLNGIIINKSLLNKFKFEILLLKKRCTFTDTVMIEQASCFLFFWGGGGVI